MGFIDGLMGNSSAISAADATKALEDVLFPNEKVEQAYKLIRDLMVFTDKRVIFVDKQGVTGKKTEYHSVPYKSITHFSTETAGSFDMESELSIWVSGTNEPIMHTFKKGSSIAEIQKLLAYHVCN